MLPGEALAAAAAAPWFESIAVLHASDLVEQLMVSGQVEVLHTMGKGECFLDATLKALGVPSTATMRCKARARLLALSLCRSPLPAQGAVHGA